MLVQFRKLDKSMDVVAVHDMPVPPRIGEAVYLTGLVAWRVADVLWYVRPASADQAVVPVVVMLKANK